MFPSRPLSLFSLLLPLSTFISLTHAASESPTPKPCTIHSPSTGSFYDLRPLGVLPPSNASMHARGWDYPANFTLNLCGPVVEDLSSAVGISKSHLQNISAFYREGDEVYSIGQSNDQLIFRGKKLLLNYTNGSPCPDLDEDGLPIPDLRRRGSQEYEDETDLEHDKTRLERPYHSSQSNRRKSTLLSLHCDTSPLLTTHPAISFLGSPDHCTYVFEIRSRYACAGATPATDSGSLGPGGVFGIIFAIAFLVYLIGGCVYQRSVMHQRGWRQLPNYSFFAGLAGFISVSVRSCFNSVFRCGRASSRGRSMSSGSATGRESRSRSGSERQRAWTKPVEDEEGPV